MLNEPDIQKSVLEKIKSGTVWMRPRVFYLLRTFLIGSGAVVVFAIALFSLSFAFFNVSENDSAFLLSFGNEGFLAFLRLFPWTFLIIFLGFVVLLELLVRSFTTAYRFSLLRVFLWILLSGVVLSSFVTSTPFHPSLLQAADRGALPFLRPLYGKVHASHTREGIYRGYISTTTNTALFISQNTGDPDSDSGTWTVVPPPGFDPRSLPRGEKVFVAGFPRDGVIQAYGVRPMPPGFTTKPGLLYFLIHYFLP